MNPDDPLSPDILLDLTCFLGTRPPHTLFCIQCGGQTKIDPDDSDEVICMYCENAEGLRTLESLEENVGFLLPLTASGLLASVLQTIQFPHGSVQEILESKDPPCGFASVEHAVQELGSLASQALQALETLSMETHVGRKLFLEKNQHLLRVARPLLSLLTYPESE